MQSVSTLWEAIFNAPHKTEYRFVINGVPYEGGNIKGTPVIIKPLLDKPAIGRVCTGSLKFTIRPKAGEIPKAATVNAFCRLLSTDGKKVSEWLPQGKYFIASRTGEDVLTLNCLDQMIKAGVTYRDKSAVTEWPAPMKTVVDEICKIMGISLDPRTIINTGPSFVVSYPNDDVLISEVLGMVAVAHGGNWIMTETGNLRLVIFSSPQTPEQVLGKTHTGFTVRGKSQTVSRVILTDTADNDFTAGDDTGMAIAAKCDYATQEMVNLLCAPTLILSNGIAYFNGATLKKDGLTVTGVTAEAGAITGYVNSVLYGVTYNPYTLDNAYLNPALELGDTLSVTDKYGVIHNVIIQSVTMNCTVACTCSLSARIDDETEDEYPFISMQDLTISRTLKTNQTYFGNRITRSEGFVSELLVNDIAKARLTANASVFSMQSTDEKGSWVDRIYFDTQSGKYVITADVTIKGVVTLEDLSTSGRTTITGDNITTGILQSKDGRVQLNLDAGTFTVKGTDVAEALEIAKNNITLLATSQLFTKTGAATSYTPTSITLTAQTSGNIISFAWYKDSALIAGATSSTYTIKPADVVQGKSVTYKVVGTDTAGNTYTDFLSIAKLSDGAPGTDGEPGKDGPAGTDGYTVILSNEYLEIPVDTSRKPIAASSHSCVVNVYKGVTPLTATLSNTLSAGQFKVTPTNTVTGIAVSQTTAGTLVLSVAEDTAILDSAALNLSITVYGDLTLTTNIVIQANMNAVTVKQQASIEANEKGIALKVSKDSIISEINQSAEEITISANKINLTGYVTISSLKNGTTSIDGACIQTGFISANHISGGTIDASDIAVINLNASNITSGTLSADRISGGTIDASKVTVTNLNASNITSGTLSADRISGGTIDASKVTVTNLNASNITSGKLSADRIDVTDLHATTIYASSGKVSLKEYSSSTMYIGGDGSWNYSYVNIFAGNQIKMATWDGVGTNALIVDVSGRCVRPATIANWSLGTISYPFGDIWCENIQLRSGSSTVARFGFNGGTFECLFSGSAVNQLGSSTYYWDTGYITKLYLGNSCYLSASGSSLCVNGTAISGSSTSGANFAGQEVKMGGSTSYYIVANTSRELRPYSLSTTYPCYLGTSAYYWHYAYIGSNTVKIGSSASSKIAFFAGTPIARQTLSTTSRDMDYSSATSSNYLYILNNLVGILKNKYGLIA